MKILGVVTFRRRVDGILQKAAHIETGEKSTERSRCQKMVENPEYFSGVI